MNRNQKHKLYFQIPKPKSLKRRIGLFATFTESSLLFLRKCGYHHPSHAPNGSKEFAQVVWSSIDGSTPDSLKKSLARHKVKRTYLFKLLGASPEEYSVLAANPPPGVYRWESKLIKEYRKSSSTRFAPLRDLRTWATVLFSTRLIRLKPELDYSSIKNGGVPDRRYSSHISKENISQFWKELGYKPFPKRVPQRVRWRKYHLSSKAGPNGPAVASSLLDWEALTPRLRDALTRMGGPLFKSIQSNLNCAWGLWPRNTDELHSRKLSSFSDLEGKTRTIAILDYWSQTILRPLHQYLFSVLRKLPRDVTFDQGAFKDLVHGWTEFYSADLSNATDRFPIKVIAKVLEGILPKEYVDDWQYVLVGEPFVVPGAEPIRYEVGNPMGAYSSWSSFTIAHHYVVWLACKLINLDYSKAKYVILGDDIVIGNKDLYLKYRELMRDFGVDISEPKTHESSYLMEFAKRWLYKGEEITPFPLPGLYEAGTSPYAIAALAFQESHRSWVLPEPGLMYSYWVDSWSKAIGWKPMNPKYLDRQVTNCRLSYLTSQVINGSLGPMEYVKQLTVYLDKPFFLERLESRWKDFVEDCGGEDYAQEWITSSPTHQLVRSMTSVFFMSSLDRFINSLSTREFLPLSQFWEEYIERRPDQRVIPPESDEFITDDRLVLFNPLEKRSGATKSFEMGSESTTPPPWEGAKEWLPHAQISSLGSYRGITDVIQRVKERQVRRTVKESPNFLKVVALADGRIRFGREGPDGMRTALESKFLLFLKDLWTPLKVAHLGPMPFIHVDLKYKPRSPLLKDSQAIDSIWNRLRWLG